MIKYFFPYKILSLKSKFFNYLIYLLLILTAVGLLYSLVLSPPDYIQGDSVRIMYIHVPSSFISLTFFGIIGVASICNLIFKIKILPLISKSLAPIGCIFSIITIITGSFWGKPTWGTWWAWDARLTSMLILFLFYIGFILTWKFINNYKKANKISSIIGIVGLINIPIIKYSVDWWSTLHQTSSITLTSTPSIHSDMLTPLIIMFLVMLFYSIIIFLMIYKTELIKFKINIKKNNFYY